MTMTRDIDIRPSIVDKISQRRRQILVHSYIYYAKNDNIITDEDWTRWARELVQLQKDYPQEAAQAVYADDFKDFDASTGFQLPYTKSEIVATAEWMLRLRNKALTMKG